MASTKKSTSDWEATKKTGSDHYKTDGCEPMDLIKDGGMFPHFALGNIIKYAFRMRNNINYKDIDKVIDYASKLAAFLAATEDTQSVGRRQHKGRTRVRRPSKG